MERNLKWRTIFLAALTLLSVVVLVPTLVPTGTNMPVWFSKISHQRIQFGLDLEGGLHIVYSIDLDKAVDDKATEIRRELEAKMKEQGIAGRINTPPRPPGAITIIVDKPEDLVRVSDGTFLSDFEEVIDPNECPPGTPDVARAYCIRVASNYADKIKKSALEQAIHTIRERINERGVAEPSVVSKGDQIIVELPGSDREEIQRVKELIERTAKLEFKVVDSGKDGTGSEYMRKLYAHVTEDARAKELGIEAQQDGWRHDKGNKDFYDYYLAAQDRVRQVSVEDAKKYGCSKPNQVEVSGQVECKVPGRVVLAEYLAGLYAATPDLKIDDEHQIGYELMRYKDPDGKVVERWRTYFLFRPVELTGSTVTEANVYFNQTTNEPYVLVQFNRFGARRFSDLTSANVGNKIAIILDDKVNSAPIIQGPIPGGSTQITMGEVNPREALKAAEDLRDVLRTGSLPAPLREDSSSQVGPLLGRDAVDKARFSFIIGSLLVVLIMVYFYRTSGVIAVVAVGLNILFMLAMMAGFRATLTLPGIAALVLSVGMGVDGNIIIYERIRDELRAGKSVKGASEAGFKRAFAAILDGHVTTAAAGFVLYEYGSGPIKGFAVMLMIGIACTLFTCTWCTRLMFDIYAGRRNKDFVLGI